MVTIMCSFSSVISSSWKATQITFAFQQKLPTYLSREFIPLLTMYSSHHKTNKQTPTKSKCIFMLSFNSNPSKEGCGEDYGGRFTRLGGCACCCHYHPWRQQSVQEREHQTKLPNQPPQEHKTILPHLYKKKSLYQKPKSIIKCYGIRNLSVRTSIRNKRWGPE